MATLDRGDRDENGRFTRTATTAERDAQAVSLHARGMSYAGIAKALGFATKGGAQKAVQRALREVVARDVEELRALQGAELDQIRRGCWRIIGSTYYKTSNSGRVVLDPADGKPLVDPAPEIAAYGVLLRAADRKAKLFGLDAPVQAKVDLTMSLTEAFDVRIAELNAQIAEVERQEVEKRRPPRWLPDLIE